jgi:hypothetical protein
VSRGVRRVWVTVVDGLLGLVVGLTTGLLLRPIDSNAIEAADTWFVGIVGVAALVGLDFWSRESERRREGERLQLEANNVLCVARLVGTHPPDRQQINVDQIEVQVMNYSGRVITDIRYELPLAELDSPLVLREGLGPSEQATQVHRVSPFAVHKDKRHLHGAKVTFSLDGFRWLGQYGQPARRCRNPTGEV